MKTEGYNHWHKVEKELRYLGSHQVVVGYFAKEKGKFLEIVAANEMGADITPKNKSGFLVVPNLQIKNFPKDDDGSPISASKMQALVGGLFRPGPKNAKKHVLVRNEGGELVVYYYLLKRVRIPPRPFMRQALITHLNKYQNLFKVGIDHIVFDDWTARKVLNRIGLLAVADVRESSIKWFKPGNKPLTIANKKGSNNPLVDTGELQRRVTYMILPL